MKYTIVLVESLVSNPRGICKLDHELKFVKVSGINDHQ